jgi:hypothetical protein
MATVKMRALMGQDRSQLRLSQSRQGGACDDDSMRPTGNAVGRGLWRIDDHRVDPVQPAANQTYGRGMPMSLAAHAHQDPHYPRCAARDCDGTKSDEYEQPKLHGVASGKATKYGQAVGKNRPLVIPMMGDVGQRKNRRRRPGH